MPEFVQRQWLRLFFTAAPPLLHTASVPSEDMEKQIVDPKSKEHTDALLAKCEAHIRRIETKIGLRPREIAFPRTPFAL